ncbi:MAG: hypothetical protein MZV64_43940 [Ignavibacteriales bacterium]|nr:hypothetical protein [Ignavibacteriales bacterium]
MTLSTTHELGLDGRPVDAADRLASGGSSGRRPWTFLRSKASVSRARVASVEPSLTTMTSKTG